MTEYYFEKNRFARGGKAIVFAIIGAVVVATVITIYILFLSAPGNDTSRQIFVVPQNFDQAKIEEKLVKEGFVRNKTSYMIVSRLLSKGNKIEVGGYSLSKSSNIFQIARDLSEEPELIWVTVKEGIRKEQIAEVMGEKLGWDLAMKSNFINKDTTVSRDYIEGVYFPDTYLVQRNATSSEIAKRMRARFEEVFAPYSAEATKKNMKWTTILKIASLIQREAGGTDDMPIISGVIWNRLDMGMKLDIDATLQYAKGVKNGIWWGPVYGVDKQINSLYNTYTKSGLPPTPICSPGLDAILSAMRPATTKCIFYLHDKNGQIHCSVTFAEHEANIEKYLR